jgi:hypothetical protein
MRLPLHCVLLLSVPLAGGAATPEFIFHELAPLDSEGPPRESLSPADIDKDGDMDFFSGGSRSDWFENRGGEGWRKRTVSDSFDTDVGAAAVDVDGDGWIDRISGSFWHRNPGPPDTGGAFRTYRFRSGFSGVHDELSGDIDGDGRPDVVDIDYDGLRWYRNPVHPDSLWPVGAINDGLPGAPPQHGGIALGDIDGDGDMDVTRVDRWYENAGGKGQAWIEHANLDFGIIWPSGYGLTAKALILDLDGDGKQDVVQAECDVPNGRVAWFRNSGGKGLAWERHMIKDSVDGQDFHSLTAADFDGDGDLDLFSTGSLSSAMPPAAYVWENLDGKGGAWSEHILRTGKEGHEAAAMDIDGDGDIDILVKSWTEGDHYYYENRRLGGAAVRRPAGTGRAGVVTYSLPWVKLFGDEGGPRDLRGRERPFPLR